MVERRFDSAHYGDDCRTSPQVRWNSTSTEGQDIAELCESARSALKKKGASLDEQLAQLDRIREVLEEHFREQEEGHWFEEMACSAPFLAPRVRELRQSRYILLTTLPRLAKLAQRLHPKQPQKRLTLLRVFDRFVEALLEFRATEHQLSQEAFACRMAGDGEK